MFPDAQMMEDLKEKLVQIALDRGVPMEEIERMYNVILVRLPETNENKHSYSETTYYGNNCKITTTVIEYEGWGSYDF